MTLWTASFWTHMTHPKRVSIAAKTPGFFKGPVYKPLTPPWPLIMSYKNEEITWEVYEAIYKSEVLDNLYAEEVAADFLDDSVLCCWERTGNCHRHIVADWFRKNGIMCMEVTFEPNADGSEGSPYGPPKRSGVSKVWEPALV